MSDPASRTDLAPLGEAPASHSVGTTYRVSDGAELHYRHWPSDDRPQGFVVGLHGIQSHAGWYDYSCSRLQQAGWDVRFLDRRGSGQNREQRGHVDHRRRLVSDVVQFLERLRGEADADQPVVLLAVSWGGRLASACAAARPDLINGLALLYPGIRSDVKPNRFQSIALRVAHGLGLHQRRIRIPLEDPALFTDQPAWQEFIRNDPDALREISLGFLHAGETLQRIADAAGSQLTMPTLVMLAGRDRIIDTPAMRDWFTTIAAEQKQLIEYADAAHTLEFEPNREQIFDDLIRWLREISL